MTQWFHSINLPDGVTPGMKSYNQLCAEADVFFRDSIEDKTFLDIGAWDGFFSFEAERRGARDVLATDHFCWSGEGWGTKENFNHAHACLNSKVRTFDIDVPELCVESVGEFDVVLFSGVFYHLKHPYLALERLASVAKERIIVETAIDLQENTRPAMVFYPGKERNGDPTNWWGPNTACVDAMLRSVGFSEIEIITYPLAHILRPEDARTIVIGKK